MRFLYLILVSLVVMLSGVAHGQMMDDVAVTDEDTPVTFNVTDNDDVFLPLLNTVDLNTSLPGRQTTASTIEGSYSVDDAGNVTFTPAQHFFGISLLKYSMNYGLLGLTEGTANITVTIDAINDPPEAKDDADLMDEDNAPITIKVLSNDADVDDGINPASIVLSNAVGGTFTANNAGEVTYTPTLNFNGIATANYTVQDFAGAVSNTAIITITVSAVNDPPVATNDVGGPIDEDTPLTLNVVSNDTDDGSIDPATVVISGATGGTFTANNLGEVTYTPIPGFNGIATASYTVKDNEGLVSNGATITITVNSVNDSPIAVNDAASMDEDALPITINILDNDSDPDGTINPATVVLSGMVNGTFTVNTSGIVTYTPASNFNGVATAKYTVQDNDGATSNEATITVTVDGINDAPVANNDGATTNEDVPITLDVVSDDTDVDGSINASSVIINGGTGGTFIANSVGAVTFTPLPGFNGIATANYTVKDNEGLVSNAATITITVNSENDPPIAVNDAASMDEDAIPITINILSNDSDPDGTINPATVVLSGMVNGTFTVNTFGVVTYTPAANFNGVATAKYTVKDNEGATSNEATITITVNGINDAPIANNDAATTDEGDPVTLNAVSNDSDVDGSINPSTVIINGGTGGTFTANSLGVVTYTPLPEFNGIATASYTVKDNEGLISNTATITITVNSVNDPPVAADDVAAMDEDGAPITINILSNDSDPDGTINQASVLLSGATNGTFSVNPSSGIVTYTPPAHFYGVATAKYTVEDNNGATSNQATITVTVNAINDPPSFVDVPDQRVLENSAQKSITVAGISAGELENETLILSATSGNPSLVLNPEVTYNGTASTATLTFTPQPNQSGIVTITVKLTDQGPPGTNEFSQPFDIEVVEVEFTSVPVTIAVPGQLYEYLIEVTDVTETLSIVATQKPAWATLTSLGENKAKLSGTPPANAPLTNVVTLQLRDGTTVLDQQQYTLIVNRPPTITSFGLQALEDTALPFTNGDFASAYTDPDNHPLSEIQFTKLPNPEHGTLKLNATPLNAGDKIPIASISSVSYNPTADYNGLDTLYWKASDGYSYSQNEAYINYVIKPVNDAPFIEFLEPAHLQYELGSEIPIKLTDAFSVRDVDDTDLMGAEIRFGSFSNYQPEKDQLLYNDTLGIQGNFNEAAGILILSGKALVKDYQAAIRSIKYNYVDLEQVKTSTIQISFTLTDGENISESKVRMIDLIYTFKDLNIPNAFTPNTGDPINDTWVITSPNTTDGSVPYEDAQIRVYNKIGSLVYEATGFERPWDGTYDGKDLPVDTYYYTIELKYNRVKYKGAVIILR